MIFYLKILPLILDLFSNIFVWNSVDAAGVVNFVTPDGWIRAPAWNSPYGGDISFYIKTVFAQGDLIDHRNSDESHIFQVLVQSSDLITVDFRSIFNAQFIILSNYIAKDGILRGNFQSQVHNLLNQVLIYLTKVLN